MSFIIYDLILLVLFAIFVSAFLYTKKKNLKREGLLLLYKAGWGIKLIKKVGRKYKKTLKFLSYISITLGYILMGVMVFLFGRIIWIYVFMPEIVQMIKIPPIMPLIPYLPSVFKLDFLPPFYFIYWILIIAIIAIPHEFAHGIYAAYNKVKIKKTGFGFFPYFLPVFLAAFVELDEKKLSKKNRFSQMSVLSAGTFANVLTGLFFFIILIGFFSVSFAPSGVMFDTYSYSIINVSAISMVNGIALENGYEDMLNLLEDSEIVNEIKTSDNIYLTTKDWIEKPENEYLYKESGMIAVYDDSPAARAQLSGAIYEVDGSEINSREDLGKAILLKSPGDEINIKTLTEDGEETYNIVLGEYPGENELPWVGIGFVNREGSGIMSKIANSIGFFRDPYVYYKPKFVFSEFTYNLLWWIVLISISVALINMLPVGIFDGGRFFYLTIAAITGSEKIGKKVFKFVTLLFLFFLFLILFFWFKNVF